jgi:ERCC4-type nuclease
MYNLTEDGISLAKELSETEDVMTSGSQSNSQPLSQFSEEEEKEIIDSTIRPPPTLSQGSVSIDSDCEIVELSDSDDSVELIEETVIEHKVTYISTLDDECDFRDEAEISIEKGELCYLVKIEMNPPQPIFHTKLTIKSVETIDDKLVILAWLADSDSQQNAKEMTKKLRFTVNSTKPPRPPIVSKPVPILIPKEIVKSTPVSTMEEISTLSQDPNSDSMDSYLVPLITPQTVQIPPNEPFEIILLVDIREKINRKDRSQWWFDQLTKQGLKCDQRQNEIGDFMWIARFKDKQEIVLDFIVERKAIDDLSSSILSERFEEQKFRMKRSKIKHKFYIVEGELSRQSWSTKSDGFLRHAMVSIQLDGFLLKQTKTSDATVIFLMELTKQIIQMGKDGGLDAICSLKQTLVDFNHFSSKSYLLPKEIFGRQISSMYGISGNKASAIVDIYPNPKALYSALEAHGESLLENIKIDGRRLGNVVSQRIYNLFCLDDYNKEVEE